MTRDDYKKFYIDFVETGLGSSVIREAKFDINLRSDTKRQEEYENLKNGMLILLLVSLIESNFLSKKKTMLRDIRKFKTISGGIPSTVDQTHLSCFVYLRDCFAHNPYAQLLRPAKNTSGFLAAIGSGKFPWASIADNKVLIDPNGLHELHLIVHQFFDEAV